MPTRFAGKVAVVTGASKGIGASVAAHLAAEGAAVVVNYASSKEGADRVVAEISRKGGRAVAVQADMAKEADVKRLFAETKKTFGRLDILVNNAGVFEFAPLEGVTSENFHRHFDINVFGLLVASREAAALIGPEGGSIINLSSIVSTFAPPTSSVYTGTKAAVEGITKVLSKELGPRNIRVNAVLPGLVDTEGARAGGFAGGSEFEKQILARTPLGRVGKPEDIARVVLFFASPDSGWVTGETLMAGGGVS
jgi:3-oxoacyl-[acyl-carrier protein] reductase